MKFLRLPFIARDEVLKHMNPHEIIFLSLLSEHARRSIRQSIFKRNGFRLTCERDWAPCPDIDGKRLEWMGETREENRIVIKWKYVDNLDTLNFVEEFKFVRKMRTIGLFQGFNFDRVVLSGLNLKMNALECRFSMSFENGIPTLYFENSMKRIWPMEVHKYVTHLFQTSSDLEVVLNLCDTSDLHESLVIKDLILHPSEKRHASSVTVELFETANVQNSVSVPRILLEAPITDDSKLFTIPNVSIRCDQWILPHQLALFTIQNARLFISFVTGASVNAFLKNWLNSDSPQLESIVVEGYSHFTVMYQAPERMYDGLFDGIETSKWDPKKRQSRYVPKASFGNERQYFFDHLDCTNATDIERSDGLLASVRIQGTFFLMFVWHERFSDAL